MINPAKIPIPDWRTAWLELSGFVQEAVDDGGTIDPLTFQEYMRELEDTAMAPSRAWFKQMTSEN